MIRKMTINKIKNFIKENNLFEGMKLRYDKDTFITMFSLEDEDKVLGGLTAKKFNFSLTAGFINSHGYLSFNDVPQIVELDNYLREYERKRFNEYLERNCR